MDGPLTKKRTEIRAAESEYKGEFSPVSIRDRYVSWYALVAILFLVDRLFKEIALGVGPRYATGTVSFTLFLNEGIAFSLPLPTDLFWPAAGIFFTLLAAYFGISLKRDRRRAAISFAILMGAISNLWDRWEHGATVDYVLFFGRSAVNLADGMILAGLIALMVLHWHEDKRVRKASSPQGLQK